MIALSNKWAPVLVSQPETGMGYQVASVVLKDGRKFNRVVVVGGYITSVQGSDDVPFAKNEIREILVNHGE